MHDFAVISLSDRLTPWEKIQKRIELAAEADLVLVIYNPRSQGRTGLIHQARDIVLKYRITNSGGNCGRELSGRMKQSLSLI